MHQRVNKYIVSSVGRWNILGIGLEWWVPIWIGVGLMLASGTLIGWQLKYIIIFLIAAFTYSWFAFSYMHDAMHTKHFWMLQNKYFKPWFLRIRRLHDMHHTQLEDSGRMFKNFGICLFLIDRVFGTLIKKPKPMNFIGLNEANKYYRERYQSK